METQERDDGKTCMSGFGMTRCGFKVLRRGRAYIPVGGLKIEKWMGEGAAQLGSPQKNDL